MSNRHISRCSALINRRSGKTGHCTRPGKVERDGAWYCRRHDPLERKCADIDRAKKDDTHWRREDAKRQFEHQEHERQIQVQAALWDSAQFLRQILQGEQLTEEWKERARHRLTPLMDILRRYQK